MDTVFIFIYIRPRQEKIIIVFIKNFKSNNYLFKISSNNNGVLLNAGFSSRSVVGAIRR